MEIQLTEISKDELLALWQDANNKKTVKIDNDNSSLKIFNDYCDWLLEHDFGSDILNELAYEISTSMSSIFAHGCTYYDYENDIDVKYTVDIHNPNTKEIFELSINGLKDDISYLNELGITKKKTTKKMPYNYNDIDWDKFNKFK